MRRIVAVVVTTLGLAGGCGGGAGAELDGGADVGRDLDGLTFTEKYSCSETLAGQSSTCVDLDQTDELVFTAIGGGYEIRDVPDTGFVYRGSFSGDAFEWTASSPDGYTEQGTWSFDADRTMFSGTSTYTANDLSYQGECSANGVEGIGTPSSPPPPLGCP